MLGPHCCVGFPVAAVSGAYCLDRVHGLLIEMASHVVGHRFLGKRASAAVTSGLWSTGLVPSCHAGSSRSEMEPTSPALAD